MIAKNTEQDEVVVEVAKIIEVKDLTVWIATVKGDKLIRQLFQVWTPSEGLVTGVQGFYPKWYSGTGCT